MIQRYSCLALLLLALVAPDGAAAAYGMISDPIRHSAFGIPYLAAPPRRAAALPVYGYPISEAFAEPSPTDGRTYLVQYFERNRLEYHPGAAGGSVELGLLGSQVYAQVYGGPPPLAPNPVLAPDPVSLAALR